MSLITIFGIEFLLQVIGAAVVIAMGVADDHVFDVCGIELQLLQSTLDVLLSLAGIIERVDDDDALRGLHRPGAGPVIADEIELVHRLHRFQRRLVLHLVVVVAEADHGFRCRRLAKTERAKEIGFRRARRGGHVPFDEGVVVLGVSRCHAECQSRGDNKNLQMQFHENTP